MDHKDSLEADEKRWEERIRQLAKHRVVPEIVRPVKKVAKAKPPAEENA
jgi:hypothetical protein